MATLALSFICYLGTTFEIATHLPKLVAKLRLHQISNLYAWHECTTEISSVKTETCCKSDSVLTTIYLVSTAFAFTPRLESLVHVDQSRKNAQSTSSLGALGDLRDYRGAYEVPYHSHPRAHSAITFQIWNDMLLVSDDE